MTVQASLTVPTILTSTATNTSFAIAKYSHAKIVRRGHFGTTQMGHVALIQPRVMMTAQSSLVIMARVFTMWMTRGITRALVMRDILDTSAVCVRLLNLDLGAKFLLK